MRQLLFFHANWCSPCKYYHKVYVAPIEEALPDRVTSIDAWNTPKMADKYDVDKLPSIVPLDDNGKGWPIRCHFNPEDMIAWLLGAGEDDFWRKPGSWKEGLLHDRSANQS